MTYEEIYDLVSKMQEDDYSNVAKIAIINEIIACFDDVSKEEQIELAKKVYIEYIGAYIFDPIRFIHALYGVSRDVDIYKTRMDAFNDPNFFDFVYRNYYEI